MFIKNILAGLLVMVILLPAQNITKGPYLAQPDGNGLIIRWELDRELDHQLQYGMEIDHLTTLPAVFVGKNPPGFLYEVWLSDLLPQTTYFYRITLPSNPGKLNQFETAPGSDGNLTFVAIGDSRSNPPVFTAIKNQIQKVEPDMVISMGDLVANGGDYPEWQEFYFGVVGEIIDHIPLVSCLGDHEGDSDNGNLFRQFFLPDSQTEKLWFSFDYGPAHFVALDYRYPDDSRMMDWFQEDMRRSTAQWKFVYMHRPCYNLGGHRTHWGSPHWPELFARYQVDIVFAGHSHQYERFFPVENPGSPDHWPVTYITTGGAGAGTYEVVESEFLAAAAESHHLTVIKISGDTLRFDAYLTDGKRFDQFLMIKKNGKYSQAYLALVKPQPELDLTNMFASSISITLHQIPLEDNPAPLNLPIGNSFLNEKLNYEIVLAPESQSSYRMNSYRDTLGYNQTKTIPIEIYSNHQICVSGWGDIEPHLRLQVFFRRGNKEYTIVGGAAEYWPDDQY